MKRQETDLNKKTSIFTFEGLNVTSRIEKGLTTLFFDPESAKKHADMKRSYVYSAYDCDNNLIGHCVPR